MGGADSSSGLRVRGGCSGSGGLGECRWCGIGGGGSGGGGCAGGVGVIDAHCVVVLVLVVNRLRQRSLSFCFNWCLCCWRGEVVGVTAGDVGGGVSAGGVGGGVGGAGVIIAGVDVWVAVTGVAAVVAVLLIELLCRGVVVVVVGDARGGKCSGGVGVVCVIVGVVGVGFVVWK